jgi:hypothetical protein
MKPRRIQRKCTQGWQMPTNAVYVGRPTFWGNPFPIGPADTIGHLDHEAAVSLYRTWLLKTRGGISRIARLWELRGKNLVCWCPLDEPCHADVLLELSNRKISR